MRGLTATGCEPAATRTPQAEVQENNTHSVVRPRADPHSVASMCAERHSEPRGGAPCAAPVLVGRRPASYTHNLREPEPEPELGIGIGARCVCVCAGSGIAATALAFPAYAPAPASEREIAARGKDLGRYCVKLAPSRRRVRVRAQGDGAWARASYSLAGCA